MGRKGTLIAFAGWLWLVPAGAAGAQAAQACNALHDAEQAARSARGQGALWTTVVESLEAARAAVARGDYEAALDAARYAQEQAELGIAQRAYPPLRTE